MKKRKKSFFDSLCDDRDPIEEQNRESGASVIAMMLPLIFLLCMPMPYLLYIITWLIAWTIIGLAVLYRRFGREARHYGSDRWTELAFGFKLWPDMIWNVILWPFELLIGTFMRMEDHSFRGQVQHLYVRDLFKKIGPKDHAYTSACEKLEFDVKNAEKQSEQIQEIPAALALTARTTGACGATMMTMAAATAGAASPAPTSPTNNISVSASGWVTVTGDIPEHGKPVGSLEYARTFVTVADSALHSSAFVEFDADTFQYSHPDALKRYYLTFDLDDQTHVSAGRMFVAGGWMLPGPTDLETVNYPRYPFTFQGYALQADKTCGQWHFLADVSGTTGLSFLDRGQFDTVETSAHITRSFGPSYQASLTWQLNDRFDRVSIDAIASPFRWLDTRAMVYYDREAPLTSTHSTSIGAYGYVGIKPVPALPGLSFHGQADYLGRLNDPIAEPLILTGGLRMQLHGDKYSLILDYQKGLGSRHAGASDGPVFAAQVKF